MIFNIIFCHVQSVDGSTIASVAPMSMLNDSKASIQQTLLAQQATGGATLVRATTQGAAQSMIKSSPSLVLNHHSGQSPIVQV